MKTTTIGIMKKLPFPAVMIGSSLLLSLVFVIYPAFFTASAAPTSRADAPGGGDGSPCYSDSECGGGQCSASFCFGGGYVDNTNYSGGGTYTANSTATYPPITYTRPGASCTLSVSVDQISGYATISGTVRSTLGGQGVPTVYGYIYDDVNPLGDEDTEDTGSLPVTLRYSASFAKGTYNAYINGNTSKPAGAGSCNTSKTFTITGVSTMPDLTVYGVAVNPSQNMGTYWSIYTATPETLSAWAKNVGGAPTPGFFPYYFQVSKGDYNNSANITNLTYGMAYQLNAFQMTPVFSSYIFPSAGSYFVRACVNQCPAGTSSCPQLVNEGTNPTGNCGDWTPVTAIAPTSTTSTTPVTFFNRVAMDCPLPSVDKSIPISLPTCATTPYTATINWGNDIPALSLSKADNAVIFKTGFEGNTALSSASASGSSYYQIFSGSDLSSGYTWPLSFPGAWVDPATTGFHGITDNLGQNRFTPQTDYIENRLDTVIGHTGAQTKVLTMDIKKPTSVWSAEQDVFQIQFDGTSANIPTEMYERYWMKFNPDLESQIQTNKSSFWRSFFGFKTGSDYRLETYIMGNGSGNAYWHLQGDNAPAGSISAYYLWQDNTTVPIPFNQWFLVEAYLNRGTPGGTDGRFYMAVNGQTIFDQRGGQFFSDPLLPVQFWGINNQPIYFMGLSFIYSSIQGPASQMIDDFELYRTYPCASLPCGSSGDDTIKYFVDISPTLQLKQDAWSSLWNRPVSGLSTGVLGGFGNYPVGATSPTSPTVTPMFNPGTTYYYRLSASPGGTHYYNTGGFSFNVPICSTIPTAPTINGPTTGDFSKLSYDYTFSSTDQAGDQVRFDVDWNNNSSITSFPSSSTYTTVSGVSGLGLATQAATQSLNNGWKSGGAHVFRVRACDDGGNCSGWSQATITIDPGPSLPVTITKDVGFGGVITDSNGQKCLSASPTCSTSVTTGSSLTITATPSSPLWVFAGWLGDCTGTSPTCVLTNINSQKNVTAKFSLRRTINYYEY